MKLLKKAVFVLSLAVLAGPSYAQNLTPTTIQSYIKGMEPIAAFASATRQSGKQIDLQLRPTGSNFKPHYSLTEQLKTKAPEEYSKLDGLVKGQGFNSVDQWAGTGDELMAAYIANKVTPQMRQNKATMAQAIGMLPPAQKKQAEVMLTMIDVAESAPAANVAAVQPFIPQIEQAMQAASKYGKVQMKNGQIEATPAPAPQKAP